MILTCFAILCRAESPNGQIKLSELTAPEPAHANPHHNSVTDGYVYESDLSFLGKPFPLDLGVIAFWGNDWKTRIINLTPATRNSHELEIDRADTHRVRITQIRRIDVGVGPAGITDIASKLTTFSPFAGILPVVGGKIVAQRLLPDYSMEKKNKKLPKIKIPFHAKDVESWYPGDQMNFDAQGGIVFTVGVGMSVAKVEAHYIATGTWDVLINKTNDHTVYVKASRKTLQGLVEKEDATIVTLQTSQFRSSDRGFSYEFDLTDPDAANAYEHMLKGNLTYAEKLAAPGKPVQQISSHESKSVGHATSWMFGLPIANFTRTTGTAYTFSSTDFVDDGTNEEVHYGISLKEKTTAGWFIPDRSKTFDFYSARYRIQSETEELKDGYWGQFLWANEREKSKAAILRKEIEQLISQTGLRPFLTVAVPDELVGYTHLVFRVMLPQESTDALMNTATAGNSEAPIQTTAAKLLDDYFSVPNDPDDLCPSYTEEHADGSTTAEKDLPRCKKRLSSLTSRAIHAMVESLRAMYETRDTDLKKFARTYAEFGRLALKNQFTFKTLMKLTTGHPLEIEYTIEGEKIARYSKKLSRQPLQPDMLELIHNNRN